MFVTTHQTIGTRLRARTGSLAVVVVGAALAIGSVLAGAIPASADTTVIVRPGENLFRIALGHGTTVQALVRANGLASPDRVYIGQRLTIPGPAARGGAVPGGAALAATAPSGGVHVVRAGENLFRISLRYGTTVPALVRANGLHSADFVYAGQRLTIPGSAAIGAGAAAVGAASAAPAASVGVTGSAGRHILVDLSAQRLTAMESGRAVASFVVSTGKAGTPTPIGSFRIYGRYRSQRMIGPGYDLPNVPYVQYFTGSYALHGTYWHNSFGVPVSHGCINMRPADAEWLWSWAGIGTPVAVQW